MRCVPMAFTFMCLSSVIPDGNGRGYTLLISNIRGIYKKNKIEEYCCGCVKYLQLCVCAVHSFKMLCSTDGEAAVNLETWHYIVRLHILKVGARPIHWTQQAFFCCIVLLFDALLCSLSSRFWSYCYCCRLNICAALKCMYARLNLKVIFEWRREALNCITHVLDAMNMSRESIDCYCGRKKWLAFSAICTFEWVCLKARGIMRLWLFSMNFRSHGSFFLEAATKCFTSHYNSSYYR